MRAATRTKTLAIKENPFLRAISLSLL